MCIYLVNGRIISEISYFFHKSKNTGPINKVKTENRNLNVQKLKEKAAAWAAAYIFILFFWPKRERAFLHTPHRRSENGW